MKQKAEDLLKVIKKNNWQNVYFLHGDEPYYINKISEYLENTILEPSERAFNQVVGYGKDSSLKTILEHAKRYPMTAKYMVILVKEAQDLLDLGKKEGRTLLSNYIKKPIKSTILIFCYKHKLLDGKTELAKSLTKANMLIESKKLYDNQISDWINQYCKNQKIKIDREAIQLLSDYVGNNIERLVKEIGKLYNNLNKVGTIITKTLVDKYVAPDNNYNIFQLQKALGDKNHLKAFQIINKQRQSGESIALVSILFDYFSKVLMMYHYPNLDIYEIAKRTKLASFMVKDYKKGVKNYSESQVLKIIENLHIADLQLKGIGYTLKESLILKELLFKILNN